MEGGLLSAAISRDDTVTEFATLTAVIAEHGATFALAASLLITTASDRGPNARLVAVTTDGLVVPRSTRN